MSSRGNTDRAGTTLVELVVAIALVTLALLTLLATSHASALLDTHTRARTAAMNRAQSVLEDVLAEPWDDLPTRHGGTFDVEVALEPGKTTRLVPGGGLTAAGAVSVTSWADAQATGDLRLVAVTVRWLSPGGSESRLRLQTVVGED